MKRMWTLLWQTSVLGLAMMAAARSETMWQRGNYAADVLWAIACLLFCAVYVLLTPERESQ